VAKAVPGERRDTVVPGHAEPLERIGELARAGMRLPVGVAVHAALDGLGDDLGRGVVAVRVADQVADEQRLVHHQAVHDSSSRSSLS
jgi:hypothetical protein